MSDDQHCRQQAEEFLAKQKVEGAKLLFVKLAGKSTLFWLGLSLSLFEKSNEFDLAGNKERKKEKRANTDTCDWCNDEQAHKATTCHLDRALTKTFWECFLPTQHRV